MVILVLNCGSSSIKHQVIDMEAARANCSRKESWNAIGLPEGDLTHKPVGKELFELHCPHPRPHYRHQTGARRADRPRTRRHRLARRGEGPPDTAWRTAESSSRELHRDRGGEIQDPLLFEIAPPHNPANLEGVLSIEKVSWRASCRSPSSTPRSTRPSRP